MYRDRIVDYQPSAYYTGQTSNYSNRIEDIGGDKMLPGPQEERENSKVRSLNT
jgi:hypothetical protein